MIDKELELISNKMIDIHQEYFDDKSEIINKEILRQNLVSILIVTSELLREVT